MAGFEKRLERATEDAKVRAGFATDHRRSHEEELARLKRIRQDAEHANYCRGMRHPIFRIGGDGHVFSAKDGKPITALTQILAEEWYWSYLDDFVPPFPRGLIHDPEAEAFYKPEAPYEMVFSREKCPINRFFWARGDDRTYISPRDPLPGPNLSPVRAAKLLAVAPCLGPGEAGGRG